MPPRKRNPTASAPRRKPEPPAEAPKRTASATTRPTPPPGLKGEALARWKQWVKVDARIQERNRKQREAGYRLVDDPAAIIRACRDGRL